MKSISKFSESQKLGLYKMLKDSTSLTPSEKKTYSDLRNYFAEKYTLENGAEILMLDGYVKEINQDTFGDVYRFGWVKIKESNKGIFYYSNYYQKRMYIN